MNFAIGPIEENMVLETDRLILRELTLNDVDNLLEVLSDREAMQFYPQPFDRPMTQCDRGSCRLG